CLVRTPSHRTSLNARAGRTLLSEGWRSAQPIVDSSKWTQEFLKYSVRVKRVGQEGPTHTCIADCALCEVCVVDEHIFREHKGKQNMRARLILVLLLLFAVTAMSQTDPAVNPDSATFDPDGTAHVTRVVPMPSTVSPEAQKWLKEIEHEAPQPKDLADLRARTDAWQKSQSAEASRL